MEYHSKSSSNRIKTCSKIIKNPNEMREKIENNKIRLLKKKCLKLACLPS